MLEPPNARNLQEIVIFYILFYMCRRDRENLRTMKNTFQVAIVNEDAQKGRYIYQAVDECDKNHSANDTKASNDGRIYEIPGNF